MTKLELIAAMEPFPDDMEVLLAVNCGYEYLQAVSPYAREIYSEDCDFEGVVNEILLKCKVTNGYEIADKLGLKS